MDWETCYRKGEIPWDLGGAAPPLLELLEERPRDIWGGGPVLVPGCGRGHDAAALARTGLEVIGLDISPRAVDEARRLHGESPGLSWQVEDLFAPRWSKPPTVGAVFEHTCFCAIDPGQRLAYVDAVARLLRPGGCLVAVFFLDPPASEGDEPGPPFGSTRAEIRELFSAAFRIERESVPKRSHPGREGREWVVEFIKRH